MRFKIAALLIVIAPLAGAATDPAVPGAGALLQQTQQFKPPGPPSTGTGLTIELDNSANLPPSAPFIVNSIQLAGNSVFDTPSLHALLADAEGNSLTLSQLGKFVNRITDYYHRHGYPLARAVIPAQTIRAGVVRIMIIEARYGKISIDNQSRVGGLWLDLTLAPVQSGHAVEQKTLDHTLLLLSDIPGVMVTATAKPGETVGTSDLQVEVASTPTVTGNAALDNDGNRYTGRARIGASVNFVNPLHAGDVLSATGLSSGRGMNYGSLTYEAMLNGQGARMGGSYSALHYILGDTLSWLDGHGTAQVESLWIKYPFVRSRDVNLYGQIQYARMQLDDRIDASDTRTDRHLDNWVTSFTGDWRDALLYGGVSTGSLGWTSGRLDFDDATAQLADAQTANTQGQFSKWNANFARLQNLWPSNALYFALSTQWSNANLDASEKMVAGGPYSVRAYDVDAVSGDSGILGSAEFRHDLGHAWDGQWQVVAFVDSQHVTVNHTTWVAGANGATLSGAGVGLNWTGAGLWHAKLAIAAPLGTTPALVGTNNSARAWAEIGTGL